MLKKIVHLLKSLTILLLLLTALETSIYKYFGNDFFNRNKEFFLCFDAEEKS